MRFFNLAKGLGLGMFAFLVSAQAQIQNGGFEDDLNGWLMNKQEGLGLSDQPGYNSAHGAVLGGGNTSGCELYQFFSTTPGTYKLQMEWAIQGNPGRIGQMEVQITTTGGEILATRFLTGETVLPLAWQTLTIPFTIPPDTTQAVVRLFDRSENGGISVDPNADNVRVVPGVSTISDLNGDSSDDLVWQHKTGGQTSVRYLTNDTAYGNAVYLPSLGPAWRLEGLADLNNDSHPDFIWRNTVSGRLLAWYMDGANFTGEQATLAPGHSLDTSWRLAAIRDFNGDGQADLLWQHRDNRLRVWEMDGLQYVRSFSLKATTAGWSAVIAADFDGDGETDLVFQHADGRLALRLLRKGGTFRSVTLPRPAAGVRLIGRSDFNQDGHSDLIFMSGAGQVSAWLMEGTTRREKIVLQKASAINAAWRLAAPR